MDFPGVACAECKTGLEIEGDPPGCETERGCVIPALSEYGARIMDMWEKLTKLRNLIDPGTILNMYGATRADLDLLMKVNGLMKGEIPKSESRNTAGRRVNG